MNRSILFIVASFAAATAVSAREPFEAFLETHCVSSHRPNREKCDLRFDQLSRNFRMGEDSHVWAEVMENVNSGEMPDGRSFKDANEFKLLLEDRDKVAQAFIEHLCTYALRRVLTMDDKDDLNTIQAEAKRATTVLRTSSAPWRFPIEFENDDLLILSY